jgi:glutamine amidotransferase-like uncharacterized protein
MSTRQTNFNDTFIRFIVIWIILIIFSSPTKSWSLDGADVAIYNDTSYGGGAWEDGIDAIKAMLDSYDYSYQDITPDEINNTSNLNSFYKMIIFPGGWAESYNTYINLQGYDNVRRFIFNGGGYFGICAGSYFASDIVIWKPEFKTSKEIYDYPLNIFHGIARGAVLGIKEWTSPTGCSSGITHGATMTTVKINNDILPDINTNLRILYYGGPTFRPFAFQHQAGKIRVVATYIVPGHPADGAPAMILFRYGKGKVFLSGPHPEISFDDCNLYYDNETWELMNEVISITLGDYK